MKKYSEHFDYIDLAKLAIDYSDGVIEAAENVNDTLLAYAKESGKPLMEYPGEDYATAYKDFYNKLLG